MTKVVLIKFAGFFAGIGSSFILAAFLQPEETSKYAAILSLINILIPVLSIGLPTMIIWSAEDKGLSKQIRKLYSTVTALSALFFTVGLLGLISGRQEWLLLVLLSLTNIARCNAAYVRVTRSSVAAALFESLGLKMVPALLFLLLALYAGLTLWRVVLLQAACALIFVLATYEYGSRPFSGAKVVMTTMKTAATKASLQFIAVAAKEVDSIIALAVMDASTAVSIFLGKRAYAIGSVVNESSRLIYQPSFSSHGVSTTSPSNAYWAARNKNVSFGTTTNVVILIAFLFVCYVANQAIISPALLDVTSSSFEFETQAIVATFLFARCVENIFGPVEQYLVMQDSHGRAALVNLSTVLIKGSILLVSVSGIYGVLLLAFARTLILAAVWAAAWIPKMEPEK